MADNKSREFIEITNEGIKAEGANLTVKINVDIAEALTGLKAVQREAKEATKALRDLENTQSSKQTYKSHRTFKHSAKYLTIELQEGTTIHVDLGKPTGEDREISIKGHHGIKCIYVTPIK